MGRYIVRRLVSLLPILFLVSFFAFGLIHLVPGDPAAAILGESVSNRELYEALRRDMGLDRPFFVQYFAWLQGLFTGSLGRSVTGQSIVAQVGSAFGPTIQLATMTMIVAIVIGVPFGIIAAIKQQSKLDVALSAVAIASFSAPGFLIGILLLYLFAVIWPIFPSGGYTPIWRDPGRSIMGMILPAFALGSSFAAVIMRQMRSAMIQTLRQDFILVAHAKGLPGTLIIFGHALRNSAIPVLTIIGLQLGNVFGGVAVIETIFSIPGLGRLAVDSIFSRNYPVLQVVILIAAVVVLLANFITDLLYAAVDPRIRYD